MYLSYLRKHIFLVLTSMLVPKQCRQLLPGSHDRQALTRSLKYPRNPSLHYYTKSSILPDNYLHSLIRPSNLNLQEKNSLVSQRNYNTTDKTKQNKNPGTFYIQITYESALVVMDIIPLHSIDPTITFLASSHVICEMQHPGILMHGQLSAHPQHQNLKVYC